MDKRHVRSPCPVADGEISGSPAVLGPSGSRSVASRRKRGPVALRPRLSPGVPLSEFNLHSLAGSRLHCLEPGQCSGDMVLFPACSHRKAPPRGRGCIKTVTWPRAPVATRGNRFLARPTSSKACVWPLEWRQAFFLHLPVSPAAMMAAISGVAAGVFLTLTCVASGKDGRDF